MNGGQEGGAAKARIAKVLVVDDDADFAEAPSGVVEHAGHEVRVAPGAHEALLIVAEFIPDVAVLDIGMPVMDGYQLLAELRKLRALGQCKFIAVTGYGGSEYRERCLSAGFHRHMTKPVSVDLLLVAIAERAASN